MKEKKKQARVSLFLSINDGYQILSTTQNKCKTKIYAYNFQLVFSQTISLIFNFVD